MLKDWLLLFRLKPNWLIMVACAIALSPSPKLSYVLLLTAFAYLVAIYGELVNMVYDHPIDLQNPKMRDYPHVNGRIQISKIKKISNLFLFMSLASAVALIVIRKETLLPLVLAFNSTYAYSVPPLRHKRYWWSGLMSYTLSCGIILLLSATILGSKMANAWTAAIAFWIGSLSLWMLAGIPDKAYDRKEGVNTPATKFGDEKCVRAYLPLSLLSSAISGAIIINEAGNPYAGIPFLLPAIIAIIAYSRMKKETRIGIKKQSLGLAILPHRYNMALVTLSFFII